MSGVITYGPRPYFSANSTYTTALSGAPAAVVGQRTPASLDSGPYWKSGVTLAGKGSNAISRARGIHIQPVGTDANDETINFRIIGWRRFDDRTTGKPVEYRAMVIWVGQATLGTNTGVANGLGTALRFADTITETTAIPAGLTGLSDFSVVIHSPADNTDAFVTIQDATHIFDGFTFDTDLGTAAAANLLISSVF